MTEVKSYPFGKLVWVKLLKRIWWPGTVVNPLSVPKELAEEYMNKVTYIAVVKFEQDSKYEVVLENDQIFDYTCDRKIEFIEKGVSFYQKQKKGLKVPGNYDMENFKKDLMSMERLIGGDIHIFEKIIKKKETIGCIVKQFFTPPKKSKKKEVERKSLPVPKLSKTSNQQKPKLSKTSNQQKPKLSKTPKQQKPKLSKTPKQQKPKLVSKPRTTTQSKVSETYDPTTLISYSCHSQVGCNFTTNRYDNLKRHMATHKNDTADDVIDNKKPSTSSTSNKRKNLKTKSSEVKKQKLQEELLRDWDNDGEDDNEELNTSEVQSSSNVAQSSNEEVVQTSEVPSSSYVQSSSEEVLQLINDVQSSSNVVQSSNDKVVQIMSDVQPSSNVVQSSNEEVVQTMSEVIPTSKVLSSVNDVIPTKSEVQETSTSSPNQVFDFNENDNNTPVVELRKSKSNSSSTVDDYVSETFESRVTPDLINNTIFDASPSESLLVEKSIENSIGKPHEIHSNKLANEIDNQTNSTELLLEKTVNTLDQINSFENSLSCISSSINNSDVNILTEDNNVIGVSELSECGSLNKTVSLYKDIHIETNGIAIPLVENMSTETVDHTIVEENTNDIEINSNDVEVDQLNGTTIDKNMPIGNLSSVDSTSNIMDCEDKITKKGEYLLDGIPNPGWKKKGDWDFVHSEFKKANFAYFEEKMYEPSLKGKPSTDAKSNLDFIIFNNSKSEIQETKRPEEIYGTSYDLFLPLYSDKPIPSMEELNPDVNPIVRACQRAMMENNFLRLNLIDK